MYRHDQIGWLMIIVVGAAAILTGVVWFLNGGMANAVTCVILILIIPIFYSLRVTADEYELNVKFGVGLIKTGFKWTEIKECKIVRNKWYFGWGVRKLDKGWMYNISGLNAVEITMNNGKIYRIGTDDPENLCSIIQSHLNRNS